MSIVWLLAVLYLILSLVCAALVVSACIWSAHLSQTRRPLVNRRRRSSMPAPQNQPHTLAGHATGVDPALHLS